MQLGDTQLNLSWNATAVKRTFLQQFNRSYFFIVEVRSQQCNTVFTSVVFIWIRYFYIKNYLPKYIKMFAAINLLERAHEFDVALTRTQTKRKNLRSRIASKLFNLSDCQYIKRYRLTKEIALELCELIPLKPPVLRSDAMDVKTKVCKHCVYKSSTKTLPTYFYFIMYVTIHNTIPNLCTIYIRYTVNSYLSIVRYINLNCLGSRS